ncbi:hypothetical protein J4414_02630 [Candidatus Woesearchaeota archaeon]|nr:hypothetical protein [Candidatus Woesearchaeota archaeon]
MDLREFEIILSAIFLLAFLGFFFNSGASSFIIGKASITGSAVYDSIPKNLNIAINNYDYSTDKNEVDLNLHAEGALECKYKNSEVSYWSNWRPYTAKKTWVLSEGLGDKEVYYQCRNDKGYSDIISDSILLVS